MLETFTLSLSLAVMDAPRKVAKAVKPIVEKIVPASLSWPLEMLDSLFRPVTKVAPNKFEYTNSLPLAKQWHVAAGVITYLVVIFSVKHFMRDQERITLKPLVFIHNVLLTLFSLALFLAMFYEVWPLAQKLSLHELLCSSQMFSPKLQYLYYLNFLGKYYELLDTVFIVLAKRPLIFLHWFHHFMTLLLTFVELEGHASVQWVPIILNLLVHVVMYLYYALSVYKKGIPWKMFVTTIQIVQFVVDLLAIYYATYALVAQRHSGWLPYVGSCHGSAFAALFGCLLLTSYLGLFINFFIKTYRPKKGAKAAKSPTRPRGSSSASGGSPSKKPSALGSQSSADEPVVTMVPRTPAKRVKTASATKATPKATPKSTKKEKSSQETPVRYSLRNRG